MQDGTGIARLEASGGVTLVSGEDAAEAAGADYDVQTGMIEMAGDVLLGAGPRGADRRPDERWIPSPGLHA